MSWHRVRCLRGETHRAGVIGRFELLASSSNAMSLMPKRFSLLAATGSFSSVYLLPSTNSPSEIVPPKRHTSHLSTSVPPKVIASRRIVAMNPVRTVRTARGPSECGAMLEAKDRRRISIFDLFAMELDVRRHLCESPHPVSGLLSWQPGDIRALLNALQRKRTRSTM